MNEKASHRTVGSSPTRGKSLLTVRPGARLRLLALVTGATTVMLASVGCERQAANDAAAPVIIRMPSEPPVTYELIPELVLGNRDGTPPDGFGNVGSIAVNSAGDIAVFDRFGFRITVFGPDGVYLRDFGGSGPGELENAAGMASDRQDTLWLVQSAVGRYRRFTFDGRALGPLGRHTRGMVLPWSPVFDTGNNVLELGLRLFNPMMSPSDRRESSDRLGRARFTPTRQNPVTGAIRYFQPVEIEYELFPGGMPSPKRVVPRMALDPAGFLWVNEGLTYSVDKRTLDGRSLFRIVGPEDPIPMSATARESVLAGYQRSPSSIRRSDLPDHVKAIARLRVGRAGGLFVFRTPRPDGSGTIIDIFDHSGVYLAQARSREWQVATRVVPVVREDVMYFVARDDLDVPYVVRARLTVVP